MWKSGPSRERYFVPSPGQLIGCSQSRNLMERMEILYSLYRHRRAQSSRFNRFFCCDVLRTVSTGINVSFMPALGRELLFFPASADAVPLPPVPLHLSPPH
jgi:hypothetical protein